MTRLDFKKAYKNLYSPSSKSVSIVEVPAFNYLMVDGQGEPNGKEALEAIQALFPVAYKIKFLLKAQAKDYAVMPFEGLWWAEDMNDFANQRRERWQWTYMIVQPHFVSRENFEAVVTELRKKKELPGLNKIRFERLEEGRAAQMLHIGPFSEEGPAIDKIHQKIKEVGGIIDGYKNKHHEIYLSDVRKVDPGKMKTVLRQPFRLRQ